MKPLIAASIICVLLGAAGRVAAQTPGAAERFLVIPFENPGHEARIYWLGEAAAVLISDNLNTLGRRAYTREERLAAFEQLQVPPVAGLSHATVIRLGQLVGATHVVIGSLTLSGTGAGQISVRAQTIRLDTGRLENEVTESGPLEDLFAISDRVGRRVASIAATVPVPSDRIEPRASLGPGRRPPLPAFENYIKGLLASAIATKVGYLQSALKLDPGFDRARLALWDVHQDHGNPQAALLAAASVQEPSHLYPQARFSVALSLIQLNRLDEAFATLKTLSDRSPSATVMNNLGVIQMRRPVTPQTGRATYYFNQALRLDQDDPDYYFNLGYAYWTEKDLQSAIFWLREAVRRNPADGEAHAGLGAALQVTGSVTEAARERELATQLSSAYAEWAKKPTTGEPIPRGLERLKPSFEVSSFRRVETAIATTEQREQRELAAFHLDRGRRFFEQGSDIEGIVELKRALYLSPYEAEAHLLLGRIYLRTGQTVAAVDAFKISLWSQETVAAHVALAQAYIQTKENDNARAQLERALVLEPDAAEARALLSTLRP